MNTPCRSAGFPTSAIALLVLVSLAGCTDGTPAIPGIDAAKGGGSGDPTVTSASPNNAPQDTTLDVAVSGSGFDNGSQALWALAGVPSAKIRTNSTRFVNPKQVIANITIALDADTVLYDVIVTTSTGKKGIGTELFKVTTKGTAGQKTFTFDDDAALYKVRSDGRGTYDPDFACVAAFSDVTGFAMLRTIRNNSVCQAQVRGVWRFLTIEGTARDLDQDGLVEPSEAAPARFDASNLYGQNATTTPVGIIAFHVNPDATTGGTTTQDSEWVIQYKNSAPISTNPVSGAKTITLTGSAAAARICRWDARTGRVTNCVSGFSLPFLVTVAPKP